MKSQIQALDRSAPILALAPSIMVPLVVAWALLGIASERLLLHARITLVAYAILFSVVGLPINRYWGLVTVPLWGLAVLHAMSGLERLCSLAPGLSAITALRRGLLRAGCQ